MTPFIPIVPRRRPEASDVLEAALDQAAAALSGPVTVLLAVALATAVTWLAFVAPGIGCLTPLGAGPG